MDDFPNIYPIIDSQHYRWLWHYLCNYLVFLTLWSCFSSLLTSNWDISTSCLPYLLNTLTQITKFFVISSYIDDIETNLLIAKNTLGVFAWHLKEIAGKGLFRCFVYVFVAICCFSCHFNDLCCWTQRCGSLSHTHLMVNRLILAEWSKSICITLWSCSWSLLTSIWEISTSRLHYNLDNFIQFTNK